MTRRRCAQINQERLAVWCVAWTDAHATPAVGIGVGHDRASGEIHICMPSDTTTEELRVLLLRAVAALGPPPAA